jgi:hypothetical protein
VSPYFFEWASKAVDKYYSNNKELQKLHLAILHAIRQKIAQWKQDDTVADDSSSSFYDFSSFVESYLGYPLFYGVCLQKQALDPQRYPKSVLLRTAGRPFLYRLKEIEYFSSSFFY